MTEKKEKKYVSDNAKLMVEWNWKKNNDLRLESKKLTVGSGIKVWWKCSKGHEWEATINNRNYGRGCPYCSSRKVLKGFNDLHTVNSIVTREWNYDKNDNLKPENFTANSNKKVWWICSQGHEWQAKIIDRNKGTGCPYCSGRKVLVGYNDIKTVNPTLAEEWNYEKNSNLKLENLSANSGKKVWWICSKGHEWQARIINRNKGAGCPYCVGQRVFKGYNDLHTINPTLAEEWNYEKNNTLNPEKVTANSGIKVWWKCKKEHEWQATISNRNNGNGCPICTSERKTSFPEYALVFYLNKYGLDTIHSYKEKGYELDVYIPSKKVAIEYDGYLWHKNKIKNDLEKNYKCKKDEITLYRIREGLPPLKNSSIDYVVQRNQNDLSKILSEILTKIIGTSIDVNLTRDSVAIENLREFTEKEKSLLFTNSTLANEWNYKRNGNLKPENFLANSNKKVWWICKKGHEWQAIINSRNKGNGCPFCTGQKVLKSYNDLQTINPNLAIEWNYEKNNILSPEKVTANSGMKVWWKCGEGHEWQATIAHRNNGCGCPYCSSRKVLKGFNDLQTVNPNLAKEWNCEKNNGLMPTDVLPNSHKKVWWTCNKGHEWEATVDSRNGECGCPYCSGRKALVGYNDLKTVNPVLAKEWDYEKNDDLRPEKYTANSHKKVWWKCNKGHKWQAIIKNRNKGTGCPYCAGRKKEQTD